ncbi:MAG: hypothetical protein ACE5E4_13020, partial [Candidatus Binatia bacterium]
MEAAFGGPPVGPDTDTDLRALGVDTHTPYLAKLCGADGGNVAHTMARWGNSRGEKGPSTSTLILTWMATSCRREGLALPFTPAGTPCTGTSQTHRGLWPSNPSPENGVHPLSRRAGGIGAGHCVHRERA